MKPYIFASNIWPILIITLSLTYRPAHAEWGNHKEWMGLIQQNCSPTIKGQAKKLFNERLFWVETNVSMGMWIEDMNLSRYEGYCYASFPNASQRGKLMSCVASIKHDFDWFNRCKRQVIFMCHKAGGYCN